MIYLITVKSRLEENKLSYKVVNLDNDAKIIVTEYGGRIFGPFLNNGKSFCWINPCFNTKVSFESFYKNKEWNLGGDRIWLAPEMQFNVPEKADFFGSYCVPENLDPGDYTLSQNKYAQAVLSQNMVLKIYDNPITKKALYVERVISPIDNPLKKVSGPDALFFGYEHNIMLKEEFNDGVISEAWNLFQVNPEGFMYIPTTTFAKYTEYYEPFAPGYQQILSTHVKLKINAKKRFKVGYKSAFTTGRSGYISENEGKAYLMIRNFCNDITGQYVKSPVHIPEETGHALHIYNDDGNFGKFAEHECSCTPIGGNTGRGTSHSRIDTMFFISSIENINEICRLLLGIEV